MGVETKVRVTLRKSLTNLSHRVVSSTPRHESDLNQGLKNLQVRDRRFVGSDLTFSIPVKTDGPVETVQLRT